MSLKLDMTCEDRVCAACICERLATCEGFKRLVTLQYAMYDSERSFFYDTFQNCSRIKELA